MVHNPADNIGLTRVINVPPRSIGEKTVSGLAAWSSELDLPMMGALALVAGDLKSPALPADALERFPKPPEHPFSGAAQRALVAFYRMAAGWLAVRDQLTVAALLDRIAEESSYATWLRDGTEEGEERWENLQELRSVAAHYDDFPPEFRLTAFLEEIALVSDQDELTGEDERVTLLTVHSAKGLEFPVVFMVGLEENIFPHSRSMEDPDQMEEERRLMYVGVTRTKDRLYLVRAFRRTLFGRSEVNEPSRFLRDVPASVTGAANGYRQGLASQGTPSAGRGGGTATLSEFRESSQREGGKGQWSFLRGSPSPRSGPAGSTLERSTSRTPEAGRKQSRAADDGRIPQFKPGDRVDHGLFGQGIVLKSELTADDEEVTVAFAGKGTKTLLVSFARLKKTG